MGLGHGVYKTRDPRALHLRNMAKIMADETRNYKYFSICDRVEEVAVPLLAEKHIYPNVDFYSSTVYNALGIPEDLFDTLFATSRITGWCAHVLEQLADNRIIRPREKYVGAMDLPYVPINERGKKETAIVQIASPVGSNSGEAVLVMPVEKEPAPAEEKQTAQDEKKQTEPEPAEEEQTKQAGSVQEIIKELAEPFFNPEPSDEGQSEPIVEAPSDTKTEINQQK